MKYSMKGTMHEIELNIDEAELSDNPQMKISLNIETANQHKAEGIIEAYKRINPLEDSWEDISSVVESVVEHEVNHSNTLKNIALIWDTDYPIMVQGDMTGNARWGLHMGLINTMISTYLSDESLTGEVRYNLEVKATLLLNFALTHNFGSDQFSPATTKEVIDEKERIVSEGC